MELYLRGPLGHGFDLPLSARKVGLIALDDSPARLRGLIQPALKHDAAVVIVCKTNSDHLPDEVEVHPVSALNDIVDWADYLAFDVARENLNQLKERLGKLNQVVAGEGVAGPYSYSNPMRGNRRMWHLCGNPEIHLEISL